MGISGERINMGRLKSWILTTFYKNELLAIQKEYERKVKEINYEAQKKTKLIDTVHRVFREPNHVIIGVETNKMGDEVLVVQWIHRLCYTTTNIKPVAIILELWLLMRSLTEKLSIFI